MRIGVLALQGDFREHAVMLKRLGVDIREVRLPHHLDDLDGLVIPGGESTTIGKLAVTYNLLGPLKAKAATMPIFGTCGGLVFMAGSVGFDQPVLGVLDMEVERNAFGRQVDSFEADLHIRGIDGGPFPGVFIRAPVVRSVGPDMDVICRLSDGRIVAVRRDRLIAMSFHPELTSDDRVHRYFLKIVAET
jgi:pyridoxal 5'-phosphate synthase pdxT subunit